MEPLLLTVPEAAEMLGISRSKTYELLSTGVLASVRIGSARRVPRSSLIRYIDALVASAADAPAAAS